MAVGCQGDGILPFLPPWDSVEIQTTQNNTDWEIDAMGTVAGKGDFSASGYVGAAIVNHHTTLSFQNFSTSAGDQPLEALLTINGNLAKRHIPLGPIPAGQAAFDLAVPPGTDISLFNTVVIRAADADLSGAVVGTATVP
jgi:hypothetical protein